MERTWPAQALCNEAPDDRTRAVLRLPHDRPGRDPQPARPVRPPGHRARRGRRQPRGHRHRRGAPRTAWSATSPSTPRARPTPQQVLERLRALPGRARALGLRPHLPPAPGRQDLTPAARCRCKTRNTLSMAYTPGVARVCQAIAEDQNKVYAFTSKANSVAVVTRRLGHPGAGQPRPGGGHAGHGRQDHALQGVRRHRRLAALPGHAGRRRDRSHRAGHRPDVRRHQPRGHQRAALLRDRRPAEGRCSTSR